MATKHVKWQLKKQFLHQEIEAMTEKEISSEEFSEFMEAKYYDVITEFLLETWNDFQEEKQEA